MTKRNLCLLYLIWAIGSATAWSQSANCDNAQCPNGGYWVVETPQGVQDGWNTTFTLKRIPSQAVPITVFRNGIPLTERDAKYIGRTLTFLPSQAPSQRDFVVVRYFALPDTNQGEVLGVSAPTSSISHDEITLQAARLALNSELSASQHGSTRRNIGSGRQVFGQSLADGHTPSAVEILESRASDRNQRSYRHYLTSQADAQGIDGLGDASLASSFKEPQNYSGRGTESGPASVRMLEEKVQTAEEKSVRGTGAIQVRSNKNTGKGRSKAKAILDDLWRSAED